ncbi:R8 protein [Sporothrix bragantina]|uniref:R8 protein n=1 Tax=Sporothrix bragantina TaxID=671064 RepID=A0ABP0CTY1_9PEZI
MAMLVLCDKRYALSTVWRAGNTAIGARTTGLHRKAVLEVSVEKTCGTIKDPPGAPIALRLQGTLLYGTARIYQEQCRYVLNDSEKTQRAMAKLYNGMFDDKIDKNAGKTKSIQILLPNDPCFDLDLFQLPPFDFDEPLDGSFLSQDRQASWTNMSLKSRSSQNTQLPQLMLDADSSASGSYAGGFRYSASGASVMPDSPTPLAQRFNFQEEDNLLLDVGLFIDENGNIIEEEPQTEPRLPDFPSRTAKVSSDNVIPMIMDDEDIFNPDPAVQAALAGNSRSKALVDSSGVNPSLITHTPSSPSTLSPSTVVSRQAHQKALRVKVNFVDYVTQIPLSDYFKYVTNYSDNMEKTIEKKNLARSTRRAHDTTLHRKVAQAFTFGRGIFCIANEVKAKYPEHPLAQMFSGEALAESVLGESLTRAKRRRVDLTEPSTPIARGHRGINLDGFDEEQDIELGRMPGSALSDNPSLALNRPSSVLPGSSAHGSVQRSASAIRQHADGRLSSAGFPDSPSFFERYSDGDMQLPPQLPSNGGDPFLPSVGSVGAAGARNGGGSVADKVQDGQGKNNDERAGEELRNVSVFYDLVRNMVTDEGLSRPEISSTHRWVEFGDVVSPYKNNRIAVVNAFMSLLTLTTARKLRIHQDEVEGNALDRDILISAKLKKRTDRKGKGKMKDKKSNKKKNKKRGFHEISEDNTSDDIDELASDHIFPSPMMPHKSFFQGS